MLRNYVKIAFRQIKKNKFFSFINILGLSLGMACSLLIFLWVKDELGVDAFHPNSSRIYSVYERQFSENKVEAYHSTPALMAEEFKKQLPEVEYATGVSWNELGSFEVGDKVIKKQGNYVSRDFLKIFSYPLLYGDAQSALNGTTGIVISRTLAESFFGSGEAAMGKTIRYQDKKDYAVTGVFENQGQNVSQKFDFLISWEVFLENNSWAKQWNININNGPKTYIKLRENANPVAFENKIRNFLDSYFKEQKSGFHIELGIQRFDQMYLYSSFKNGKIAGGRIEYVRLFSLVAIFILLIACINFMNLTTARSAKRAKEIGIRKVSGAAKWALVRQFIGEAVILAFLSLALSLFLVKILLPAFNLLTHKEITLPVLSLNFWITTVILVLVTGMISGSYPAFFLSSFEPIKVLKGGLRIGTATTNFRKGLVVFQFILSIILIIATVVVSQQINYIQTKNLGYERENLVYIPLEDELNNKYMLFKDKAMGMPGIRDVTRITQVPTQVDVGTYDVSWETKDPNEKKMFIWASVGYDFVKTMNLKMTEGREFSKDFPADTSGYIINESAAKELGYSEPVGKSIVFWGKRGEIIGVVKDFHFNSFHEPIRPLIMRMGENEIWGNALVRTQPGKTTEALQSIETLCKMINPKFPFSYEFSDESYQNLYTSEQVISKLANYFAILAILISCLGLLGLAMFTAEQRTKEIGIRKVLGAGSASIFALLSREFMSLVCIALIISTPLAWWAMHRWLEEFAYRVELNWQMFAIAGVAAILIALLTVSFHAIKAAVANPVKSLRTE